MSRRRVNVAGVVRWVNTPVDWPDEPAQREPFVWSGELDRHPDVDRCERCGSWRWAGVCRTPHELALWPNGGRQVGNLDRDGRRVRISSAVARARRGVL